MFAAGDIAYNLEVPCDSRVDLIIFRHDSELGNAPSYKLFDKVKVARKEGVIAPRSYADYTVTVEEDLPAGVTCERRS